jgi:hypothetical protein
MKTIRGTLHLNAKKIMELTKILESKRGPQLDKEAITSSRGGTHHNNIINIDKQENSDLRPPKNKEGSVSSRCNKPKTRKNSTQPSMPSTRSLFQSIESLIKSTNITRT